MAKIDIIQWGVEIILPVLTAVAGFFAGKKKRDNDFLNELQKSINALSKDNAELIKRTIELNKELVAVKQQNAELQSKVEALRRENAELKTEIEGLKAQLDGVKTITRIKKDV